MNSLSWLVYLSYVIPNLGVVLVTMALALCFIIGGAFIYSRTAMSDGKRYPNMYPDAYENGQKAHKFLLKILWIPFVLICLSIFIPSRETMYMIAASQVGETVIQLEQVQSLGGEVGGLASDTIELLRQNIQEQLTQSPVEAD